MKNNKGFTLMELLAALFIGGMVTGALVLVWKTASVQTSQGQRQTIIRNQVSSFVRHLYRDFYAADIIADPIINNSNPNITILLTGLKKAKRIDETHYEPFAMGSSAEGPTKAFVYCLVNDREIKRLEQIIYYDSDNPIQDLYPYGVSHQSALATNLGATCTSNGITVLRDFQLDLATRGTNGQYILRGVVQRTFADVTSTTPIRVEINETLVESGGI